MDALRYELSEGQWRRIEFLLLLEFGRWVVRLRITDAS